MRARVRVRSASTLSLSTRCSLLHLCVRAGRLRHDGAHVLRLVLLGTLVRLPHEGRLLLQDPFPVHLDDLADGGDLTGRQQEGLEAQQNRACSGASSIETNSKTPIQPSANLA